MNEEGRKVDADAWSLTQIQAKKATATKFCTNCEFLRKLGNYAQREIGANFDHSVAHFLELCAQPMRVVCAGFGMKVACVDF